MKGDDILQRAELKKDAFRVPEGYFDNLPARVASRVATNGKTSGRRVTIGRFWPLAAAAGLAAIAIGTWRFFAPASPAATASADQEYLTYINVSDAQLAEYDAADTQDGLTQDEIMEYLAYTDISGAYIYDQMAEAE